MKDHWNELARRARKFRAPGPEMPFGFDSAVLRRVESTELEGLIDAWLPLLRPALGLAFATAILCVMLQARAQQEQAPSLLVETENLIRFAVLK